MEIITALALVSVFLTIIFQFWSIFDRKNWLLMPLCFCFGLDVAFGFSMLLLRHS